MKRPSMPQPLTEAEVAEAERQLRVSFPDEYRAYLLEVSAGGAVFRLERTERGWWWAENSATRRELLSVPFPHPDSYADADDELDAREPQAQDFPDQRSYGDAWNAWDAECEEFEDRKTAGAVIAGDHGCGFFTLLVITGPLAGTVWWDGRATCGLIVPLSLDHSGGAQPIEFGNWIKRESWSLLPPGWG
ncbi:SMI1/KNR4 family protein [Streptomyces sp. ISL-100]|uniref:SMI1/KNR4 family protein n=1 Tax=Streptomyces sp. ISL-100 TaxID=2819173 RepID=UPI001BED1450|nr:SMI1/KNR4 family protein [Streptomyces sp. ISL-100]MBT2396381.1 SMI1/KNR4 family protein [Streptomyces sp. ISL-100]